MAESFTVSKTSLNKLDPFDAIMIAIRERVRKTEFGEIALQIKVKNRTPQCMKMVIEENLNL